MKRFEDLLDGIEVIFYSPEEYKTTFGGSLEGEFVAAMECYKFHHEDSQDEPLEGLRGVWVSESEMPESIGGVATELFEIPQEDIEIDHEKGLVLLKRWSPELFMTTSLSLEDVRDI
jgi:hypothetical protein